MKIVAKTDVATTDLLRNASRGRDVELIYRRGKVFLWCHCETVKKSRFQGLVTRGRN